MKLNIQLYKVTNKLCYSRSSLIFVWYYFTIFSISAQQPTIQDCLGAIPVCVQVYNENRSPSGFGPFANEISPNITCLQDDNNATWYTFTVNASGNFGFLLTPNDLNDDYDWALFDLTNATCADIRSDASLLVSCNAAGGMSCNGLTGAGGQTSFQLQGFGCNGSPPVMAQTAHNALIPVIAGNTYVLLISNWTSSINGYTIDFGLSEDIGVIDDIPPVVRSTRSDTILGCPPSQITFEFSEFIQCSTVQVDNFELTDDRGNIYNITLASPICDMGADYTRTFDIILQQELTISTSYNLTLTGDNQFEILDLCDNPLIGDFSYNFEISVDPLQDLMFSDTLLCDEDMLILNIADPGASQYLWQDGSTSDIYTIDQTGDYSVTVSNACLSKEDSISVEIISAAARDINVDLGPDSILCTGNVITLNTGLNNILMYHWNDGNDDHPRSISEAGQYVLTVSDICGILDMDTIVINVIDIPISSMLGNDTLLCTGDMINLNLADPNAQSYKWSDGTTESNLIVSQGGTYSVTITNECESNISEIEIIESSCVSCNVYIPNSLSINSNIGNDIFTISSNCSFQNYNLKIFDRWGGLVFKSNTPQTIWDGKLKNAKVNSGVYVYSFKYSYVEFGILVEKHEAGDVFITE